MPHHTNILNYYIKIAGKERNSQTKKKKIFCNSSKFIIFALLIFKGWRRSSVGRAED
jgi:hypothetical protein